jgi:predicted nucleotidyltransferase
MLDTLITSKTRLKLLMKFFLNPGTRAYLRALSEEFGDSTNSIRVELNRFEEAGMLSSEEEGNRKFFRANTRHPLFVDVHNMLRKFTGIDEIVAQVLERLGNVRRVYVEGALAEGKETDVIDLVLIGANEGESEGINRAYLTQLIEKVEPHLGKHIRYVLLNEGEEKQYIEKKKNKPLLIWNHD